MSIDTLHLCPYFFAGPLQYKPTMYPCIQQFPDFEKHSCNTIRNQQVAALLLFPQAPNPATEDAHSIGKSHPIYRIW